MSKTAQQSTLRLLSSGEAARILHIHPETLKDYARKNYISFTRTPGGHYRFAQADVEALVAQQKAVQSGGSLAGAPIGSALVGEEFDAGEDVWQVERATVDGFLCRQLDGGEHDVYFPREDVTRFLAAQTQGEEGRLREWVATLKPGDVLHILSVDMFFLMRVVSTKGRIIYSTPIGVLGREYDDPKLRDALAHYIKVEVPLRNEYGSVSRVWPQYIAESPVFQPQKDYDGGYVSLGDKDLVVLLDEGEYRLASERRSEAVISFFKAGRDDRKRLAELAEQVVDTPEYEKLRQLDKLVITMHPGETIDWRKLNEEVDVDSYSWPDAAAVCYDLRSDILVGQALEELQTAVEEDWGQLVLETTDGCTQYVYTTTGGVGEDYEGELQTYAAAILLDPCLYEPLGIASVSYQH